MNIVRPQMFSIYIEKTTKKVDIQSLEVKINKPAVKTT